MFKQKSLVCACFKNNCACVRSTKVARVRVFQRQMLLCFKHKSCSCAAGFTRLFVTEGFTRTSQRLSKSRGLDTKFDDRSGGKCPAAISPPPGFDAPNSLKPKHTSYEISLIYSQMLRQEHRFFPCTCLVMKYLMCSEDVFSSHKKLMKSKMLFIFAFSRVK